MTIDELRKTGRVIIEAKAGSDRYHLRRPRTETDPGSDDDYVIIYLDRPEDIFNVKGVQNEVISDERHDFNCFSLRKFFTLAATCNPNIIEILWMPEDCIIYKTSLWDKIVANRDLFLSKKAANTFGKYAVGQIKKSHGLNKKDAQVPLYVNDKGIELLKLMLTAPPHIRPQYRIGNAERIRTRFGDNFLKYLKEHTNMDYKWTPFEEQAYDGKELIYEDDVKAMYPPELGDYIKWLSRPDENGFMYRPTPFTENACSYDASFVEGSINLYRLYWGGKGFISSDGTQVVCESISKQRERSQIAGLVKIDMVAYRKAKDEYNSFWDWMNKKNDERHVRDLNADTLVDTKNMMHTVRLLLCCKEIATKGYPKVTFEGDDRQFLFDIRNGKFSYKSILDLVDKLSAEIEEAFKTSPLPDEADEDKINALLLEIMKEKLFA